MTEGLGISVSSVTMNWSTPGYDGTLGTVQAGSACKLWSLTPMRFSELSNRHPTVALALAMALGAIMAKRVVSNRRRIAVT